MNTGANEKLLRVAACVALALGLAATLRAFVVLDGFWEDEFFTIAPINEKFPHFFVAVARFDQHPPFHYFQVKLWSAIFTSDKGLLLNSVVWHLVSCLVIFSVGRTWLGSTAGLLAAALYAVVPQVVWASATLRAYSMIPGLAIGAWWLNVRVLSADERRWWQWAGLAGVELALGYSHPIAFYFVAWIALSAAVQVYGEKGRAAPWGRWFLVQACVGVAFLPFVVSALVRNLPLDVDPTSFLSYLGSMVSGWGMKSALGLGLGALLYLAAVVLGLASKPMRPLTIGVLIVPFALAMLVTYVLKPMFKTPVFSSMLVPFACLVLAGGLLALRGAWGKWIAIAVLSVMAVAVIPVSRQLLDRTSPWQPISAELKRRAQQGDVVVAAKPFVYWALMRYVVGPDWGSPLEVAPLQPNPEWRRLLDRLGPGLREALKLTPKTDHIIHEGVTYVIGEDAVRDSRSAKRVWVLRPRSYPLPVQLAEGFEDKGIAFRFGDREQVDVQLFERRAE